VVLCDIVWSVVYCACIMCDNVCVVVVVVLVVWMCGGVGWCVMCMLVWRVCCGDMVL
jgi:hypothetical protein